MSRESLLKSMQTLEELGLNRGTSGNASIRQKNGFLVSPSGVAVRELTCTHMVEMNMQGEATRAGKPSSEWRFHRDIYLARPEINAVIHTHSMFATTMACLHKEIPPFHYMIAIAGGSNIRCAQYQLFGTQALSDAAILALEGRRACLLAKHGMIAIGSNIQQAMDIAIEVEGLCEQYWRALQISTPENLTSEEMDKVFEQFKDYGNWNK
jgi:L-fuculose-phosphate aldolase